MAYKRIDLIIKAFARLNKPLVVIGTGPLEQELRRLAGPTVRMIGQADDRTLTDYMERCRALVVAADEDFGITTVEAQAAGAPVVGLGRGGTCETVIDGQTGVLFHRQHPDDLCQAVARLESLLPLVQSSQLRQHAERFSKPRFERELQSFVDQAWSRFSKTGDV